MMSYFVLARLFSFILGIILRKRLGISELYKWFLLVVVHKLQAKNGPSKGIFWISHNIISKAMNYSYHRRTWEQPFCCFSCFACRHHFAGQCRIRSLAMIVRSTSASIPKNDCFAVCLCIFITMIKCNKCRDSLRGLRICINSLEW